jgi:hypothetical protein
MKPITSIAFLAAGLLCPLAGCQQGAAKPSSALLPTRLEQFPLPPENVVIASPIGTARPPFAFNVSDEKLLDEVQRGAWNWLIASSHPVTGMVPDRTSQPEISLAGVGFQLASLPVGVERGWITKADAQARAMKVLTVLRDKREIKKFGLYQHFIDPATAGIHSGNQEQLISTIDSALFFSGCIVASSYFGGEVASVADALVADADWSKFMLRAPASSKTKPEEIGYLSLGWKPKHPKSDPTGDGEFLPYYWQDSGCEHRLITFLAVASPKPEHRIEPEAYYRLRRQLGAYQEIGPIVYFPWSGCLFVNQFSHVFMNYNAMGPDDPAAFAQPSRARVDWWENSRRMSLVHQRKCAENPKNSKSFSADSWGLTPSAHPSGYIVTGVFPNLLPMPGARPGYDFTHDYTPADNFGDGTIAPYGAGMSIMFTPELTLRALRHWRELSQRESAWRKLWSDPSNGGFGFVDAFNRDTGWICDEHLAIDQLPMLLSIENARTGLVWQLFHAHPMVQAGMARLKLKLGKLEG